MLSEYLFKNDLPLQLVVENLLKALIATAAPHRDVLHLLVEIRDADGKKAVLFTSGSPAQPSAYSTLVPDVVAEAAYAVAEFFLQKYTDSFTGYEVLLSRDGSVWQPDFHLLLEPGARWSELPRIPLRVCGHGFSLTPNLSTLYRWRSDSVNSRLVATSRPADMNLNAVKKIQVDYGADKFEVLAGEGVSRIEQVLEACEGPFYTDWIIETPDFWIAWPESLDLRSPLASRTRFELADDANSLLFLQGPFEHSEVSLDDMVAEGQVEVGRGVSPAGHHFVELSYSIEEAHWLQRQYLNLSSAQAAYVVTCQSLAEHRQHVFDCADLVVDSLKPVAGR